MKFLNPVIPGFHPDPSVCRREQDYYLVNSSFEYFPGVPLFHSRDLTHWHQIGHCLTRNSQNVLSQIKCSDGIYAPTVRYYNDRFYMVTTSTTLGNFFVWTDDPGGDWSEPVRVAQKGIDPSLFFEGDTVYFTSNGTLWADVRGLYQCEIDMTTGAQRTETQFIWAGSGGSYPEAPHLFRRGRWYYLVAAEGGTERCHMVTVARSENPYGPFEDCPYNPILSHRSLMSAIQGTGHADFVEDHHGQWWVVFLGFRETLSHFHTLGRETFLAPVEWTVDNWPIINQNEPITLEMSTRRRLTEYSWPPDPVRDEFDDPRLNLWWNFLRNPAPEDWSLSERTSALRLRCSPMTLDDMESPAFIGRRQAHMTCQFSAQVDFSPCSEFEEAGLVVLLDSNHHTEIVISRRANQRVVVVRRRIGSLIAETVGVSLPDGPVKLMVAATREWYVLNVGLADGTWLEAGRHETRYLSTEVAGGYTGVYFGLYAGARQQESANAAYFDWSDYCAEK